MPVQISHIKLAMKRLWGSAPVLLKQLDAARDEGIDITADIYPYTFWQSHMMVLLPERDPLDMSAIDLVMRELAPPEGIIFTHFPAEPSYVGKTLVEIAGLRNESPGEAFSQLAQQSIAYEEKTGQSGDMMIGTSMDEGDLRDLMAWPHTNICTDGGLQDRHPRGAGSFPRVLGYYARDAALFSLESAVQKMTALPAQHLGMKDRGMIKPGYKADLVLFDPATVIDRATTSEPFLAAVGISDVWVNGTRVMENGHPTEAYPGRVVRRTSTP
jgi:N-acyl-D-amino-acid deacylase